jgi:hypothetical protein
MPIASTEEFESAMQEFQRLRDASDDSPEGRRRMELDAEIRPMTPLGAEVVGVESRRVVAAACRDAIDITPHQHPT